MAYGELRFEDEDDGAAFHEECEFCGRISGHDPDCVMTDKYDAFDEIEDV
ncbi:MAG: hypothetical protein GF401_14845 [Chitinivibrionales bacterium]|nr:hypothetical protein [Chitinivibrionales bacterium]